MKKQAIILAILVSGMPAPSQASLGTPVTPPTGKMNIKNLNAPGSKYAQQYGHATTSLINKVARQIIYDAAPQQYWDLKILSEKKFEQRNSDEIFYTETGFGRDPIYLDAVAIAIPAGATQTLPILNIDSVSKDTIVVYPGNERGTVTSVNTSTNEIIVTAETGSILPQVPISASGQFMLANLSPIESDSATSISQYFRIQTVERVNFIQSIVKAQRWGKKELEKYKRAGTLTNYIEMNKKRLYDQFRIDLSNIFWNGNMGEVTLANGDKAKTAGGVFPIMQQNGSPNASVTIANSGDALEELALDTEYGEYGATRFVYGTPRAIHYVTKQYKNNLVRYAPKDKEVYTGLSSIDIGSSKIVFVPVKRFEEPSCFPAAWRSRLILLDNKNIQPVYFMPEDMGETLDRTNNGTLNNYKDHWISADFGMEFYNPLACGWLDLTDLP